MSKKRLVVGVLAATALAACTSSGGGGASSGATAADLRGDPAALKIAGLAVYLPMDGDTHDRAGTDNHGLVVASEMVADRFGYAEGALALDGAKGHVVLTREALARTPEAFTVSLWVSTQTTDTAGLVFLGQANGGGMWLRLMPDKGVLQAASQGSFKLDVPADIANGAWSHVALVYTGTAVALYLDGENAGSVEVFGPLSLADGPAVFGRLGGAGELGEAYLAGALDDIAIFTRALNPNEIGTLTDEGPGRPPTAYAGPDRTVYSGGVNLDGTGSTDPDGEVVKYVWDLGDGSTKEGANVEHEFTEPGVYEVTLTVIDDQGNEATDTVVIEVADMDDDWPATWSQLELDMLDQVNVERARGANCGGDVFPPAPPVELNPVIRIAARLHSQDMAEQNYFSHDSLDGRAFSDRMADAGYTGAAPWGENIAAGSSTAAGAMKGLMDSPGHCRNIMNPTYRVMAVGYFFEPTSDFGHYWTQNFGGGH